MLFLLSINDMTNFLVYSSIQHTFILKIKIIPFVPFLFHLICHDHVLMSLSTFIPGKSSWLHCIPLHGSVIICLANHFPIAGHLADMSQSSEENKPHMLF